VARYDADGRLDATFGSGGRVTADFGGDVDDAQGVTLQRRRADRRDRIGHHGHGRP
jgi:hypothetical protein